MSFTQLIRAGDYTEQQKTRVIDFISSLIIDERSEYEITISPYKQNKTSEQLGYYWPVIVPVCMEWHSIIKEEADIYLKEKCAIPRVITIMDEVFEVRASIAKMKIGEMSKYIDDCINFLGSHGQYVPPPPHQDMFNQRIDNDYVKQT